MKALLTEAEIDVLRRVLRAVDGIVPEFVIAGGQAARLLRYHPLAVAVDWAPLLTSDIDVATVDRGHRGHRLAEALEGEGFVASFEGDDSPPRTHYELGEAELELIVPDLPRRHSTGATVSILGASAQKVKDLGPLLIDPVTVEVPAVGPVRLPNPAAYIIQKVITLNDRRSLGKKAKDAVYAHDALLLFTHGGRLHPSVAAQAAIVLAALSPSQRKRLHRNAQSLGDDRIDFVVEGSRQITGLRDSPTSAHAMATANRLGLEELLRASTKR